MPPACASAFYMDNSKKDPEALLLMKRFPSPHYFVRALACAVVAAVLPLSAQDAPKGPERWAPQIAEFEKQDAEKQPEKGGIVFTGSSSIRMWKTLGQDFPSHNVINRGFGGSQIADAIHFSDRLVVAYAPRMVVMYSGGNDINAGKAPEQVAADFRTFVEKVRAKLPEVKIAYISIAGNPARWKQVEKVKAANALIAEYCKTTPGVEFIDVFSQMLGEDGLPKPEIFLKDRLHMNAEGYKLWTGIVGPFLGAADHTGK